MQSKKFNIYKLLDDIDKKLENREVDVNNLPKNILHQTGDILVYKGYDIALAFVLGKFNEESGFQDKENKKTLAIRDIIEKLKEKNLPLEDSSYIIRNLIVLLTVYKEENKNG